MMECAGTAQYLLVRVVYVLIVETIEIIIGTQLILSRIHVGQQ
jgi:hypothetical protein